MSRRLVILSVFLGVAAACAAGQHAAPSLTAIEHAIVIYQPRTA